MTIDKQKLQLIVLGALGAGAVIFLLVFFVVIPRWDAWNENVERSEELQKKLKDGRFGIKRRPRLQVQVDALQSNLTAQSKWIPLPAIGDNYLIEATEVIRQASRGLRIEALRVTEQDRSPLGGGSGQFMVYQAKVDCKIGYFDLLRWLKVIEAGNPLVSIAALNIELQPENMDKHRVSFTVAWLVWMDPASRPAFLREGHVADTVPPPEPVEDGLPK